MSGVSESGLTSGADPLLASTRAGETGLFSSVPAAGAHEVIVSSPRHVRSLAELEAEELEGAVAAWRARIAAHATDASLVHLIVNEGPGAGASIEHSPRPALRAGVRAGRGRPPARALRRL